MDTGLRARRHGFELGGGVIAEGRMPAASVIEYFDPFENVLPGFFTCPIALMMHVFRFERMKETFNHGIPAGPAPTHARRQAVPGEQFAVLGGGILGPAVRMMHHAARRSSVFHGHGERRRYQLLRSPRQ